MEVLTRKEFSELYKIPLRTVDYLVSTGQVPFKLTHAGTTVQVPDVWSDDDTWKRLIFTDEQPFLSGEALENWLAAKQRYRDKKAAGEL